VTARDYAAGIEPGGTVRWRALEISALAAYPRVVRALDPSGKYRAEAGPAAKARKVAYRVFGIPLLLVGLVAVILFIFPVIAGYATLLGDRFGQTRYDPHVTIPIAGWIFVYQLVVLVVSYALWVRRGRAKDAFRESQVVTVVIFGALSAFTAAARGSAAVVPLWQFWTFVMAVCTAFAVYFLVVLLIARRAAAAQRTKDASAASSGASAGAAGSGRASASAAGSGRASRGAASSGTAVEPLKAVRLAVEKIPAAQQAAVRDDIDGAIDDLVSRGIVSQPDADWAKAAPLGKLALQMSQPRPRGTAPAPTHSAPARTHSAPAPTHSAPADEKEG
jgi:hypothetical protein